MKVDKGTVEIAGTNGETTTQGLASTSTSWTSTREIGRAVQQSTLKAWGGKDENIKKAQDALFARCNANSHATLGTYKGDATLAEGASESLHVKDYKY